MAWFAEVAELAERMAALHVNGVSIAVIHNGAIEWAQGFGVQQVGGKPVTAESEQGKQG